MKSREDVIKGLECCVSGQCAKDCPYIDVDCPVNIAKDALALLKALDVTPEELESLKMCRHNCKIYCLLESFNRVTEERDALRKAQEPRVMAWQDAEAMRLCWIETKWPHTIRPADILHYFDGSPNITVFTIHQAPMDWPIDEYGIKWRCWDKEPTKEQMEATPWDI